VVTRLRRRLEAETNSSADNQKAGTYTEDTALVTFFWGGQSGEAAPVGRKRQTFDDLSNLGYTIRFSLCITGNVLYARHKPDVGPGNYYRPGHKQWHTQKLVAQLSNGTRFSRRAGVRHISSRFRISGITLLIQRSYRALRPKRWCQCGASTRLLFAPRRATVW